jgi:hypothetical protein
MNKKTNTPDESTKVADSASIEELSQKALDRFGRMLRESAFPSVWASLEQPFWEFKQHFPDWCHALSASPFAERLLPYKPSEALTFIAPDGSVAVLYNIARDIQEEPAEEAKKIDECLAQIEKKRQKMQEDQKEIEKLGQETRKIISKLIAR